MTVLDASAILAFARGEAGSVAVEGIIEGASCSAVNWSEVATRAQREGVHPPRLRARLQALGLGIVPFDTEQAEAAAALEDIGRPLGLSLGDRACLALGQLLDEPVFTADRKWAQLPDAGVQIHLIR